MNGHIVNKKAKECRPSPSSDNLTVAINKLYVDCLGLNVGLYYLEMMDLNSLQEHFNKVFGFSEEATKLKNLSGSQHCRLDGDTEVYASRLQKIQEVSNSMIKEIVLVYQKLMIQYNSEKTEKNTPDTKVEEISSTKPKTSLSNGAVLEPVPESNPKLETSAITVTTESSVLKSLADYDIKFEDLFRNAHPDDLPELRHWFNFDGEINPTVYEKLFSDSNGKAPPEFKETLQSIFADINWKNYDDKLKQFDLTDPTKLGEQLKLLMDYMHMKMIDRKLNKELFALFETFLSDYFELIIYNGSENNSETMSFIQFKHLFSFKIRSMFFDSSGLNLDNGLERLNNARWITIFCKSSVFNPNIILICLKYLVNQNDRFHMECFNYMINWFGIDSMKQLDQPKNSIEKKFIDSIFDCLTKKIAHDTGIPASILDTLKEINKLRANNWSN